MAEMSWVKPLDPTCGLLGLSRHPARPSPAPRPPRPVAPPGPAPCASQPAARPRPTRREMVLAALASVEGATTPQGVAVGDVVLAAWRMWPRSFAIKGHTEHPCSATVLAKLADAANRPLIERPLTGRVRLALAGETFLARRAAGRR